MSDQDNRSDELLPPPEILDQEAQWIAEWIIQGGYDTAVEMYQKRLDRCVYEIEWTNMINVNLSRELRLIVDDRQPTKQAQVMTAKLHITSSGVDICTPFPIRYKKPLL